MLVAPVLEAGVIVAPVLLATNTTVSSAGATSTVALVLNTSADSTSATNN